ncbi:hypothetical protein Sste5346_004800 [Sporothrix stenoceras]|uniref:Xylanolytic transcriptional activator regulatory domain-containing protein n=1 Tax=Sporothrix stenoceras TaxID=5173 RepID=A0ABR3Z604_9PEZI
MVTHSARQAQVTASPASTIAASVASTRISLATLPPVDLLADKSLVRDLCDAFFNEVAPLRCFGFLHRHTFLQEVDASASHPSEDPLLLSVCALATKTIEMRKRGLWDIGCRWACDAQAAVFMGIQDITIRRCMCLVLLYEHASRAGEPRLCFLLSGMASRLTQALSLNLEYDHDVLEVSRMSAADRESRRRLMWACYLMDTMLACGLRDLQVLETSSLRIQLPCDDRHFRYKVACRTAVVDTKFMKKKDTVRSTSIDTQNQGLDAFLVRLYLVRDHVLQYINSDTDEDDPWRLVALIADLDAWKEALTPELQFNSDVIAVRKEESKLAALVSLHVMYHQVNCLLYRCTIPSMLFPARMHTGLSVKASPDFLAESRKGWFGHACAMSAIFEVSLQHQPLSMTDQAVAPSAYNAIIIKWLYLTNFVPLDEKQAQLEVILPLVDIDLQFLQAMASYHPASVGMIVALAERLVDEAKRRISRNPAVRLSETGIPTADHNHLSPDYRMNQLSTFARMRKTIPDVHAPDSRGGGSVSTPINSPGSLMSPGTGSATSPQSIDPWAGDTERLWMWSE